MEARHNTIHIGIPRLIWRGGSARLESDISWQHKGQEIKENIWFEVDDEWGKYFMTEMSDPFILAMFEVAIEEGLDIICEAPISEDLKYNLETYFIPIFAKKASGLKPFKLIGDTVSSRIESQGVAGTGFSAGVDSFYSVLSHINIPYETKRVTHLLLAVNGAAQTGITAELDQEWYKEEMSKFRGYADEMGLKLIGVNSNVSLLNHYRNLFKGGSGITTSGFVFALRKLFGTYYWASAYEADVLEFRTDDVGYLEPFFLPLLSVDGLRFYHSGAEVNRMEKVEFIADNPVVQKGLTVCGYTTNCGVCSKCTRTMAELYAIDKLDKFKQVFPRIEAYKKHFGRSLGRELAQDHSPFTTEILDMMNKNGKKIPVTAYFWKWCWFKPFFFLKKKLKYNKFLMKLYYENGWLERLGENRPSDEIIKARLSGERLEK